MNSKLESSEILQLKQALKQGLDAIHLKTSLEQEEKLILFLNLLAEWNRVHNLTGIKNIQDMVNYHLVDSLVIAPLLNGKQVLDLGTGAGLPGIPLAIMRPDLFFILLDSNHKKMDFVQFALAQLGIKNAQAQTMRIEDYHPTVLMDWVITRATFAPYDCIEKAQQVLKKEGRFLLLRGKTQEEDLRLPAGFLVEELKFYELMEFSNRSWVKIKRVEEGQNL